MKVRLLLVLLIFANSVFSQELQQDISVHDPVMIKSDGTYYVFATGQGIRVWSSKDKQSWKAESPVFAAAPAWAVEAIPGFKGHTWAPDIFYDGAQYYLYYSVSTFGKNSSAIGVATNKTLNPESSDFKWTDHGKIIQSVPGKTNWNAIDPNVILDEHHVPWMVFGSFWDGIKLVRLNQDLLQVSGDTLTIPTIASRKENDAAPGANPIEAPFLFKKGKYFYLFASIDYCCRGAQSTYKMIVGRSTSVTGPYLDAAGIELSKGGGTLVLEGDARWHGVGHNAVIAMDGADYLVFHGYDANDKGKPKLRIEQLKWLNDWPVVQVP